MSTQPEFQPTNAQGEVMEVLVRLVGLSGVHKRPVQGGDVILDLLPGAHVMWGGEPFCVRVTPRGVLSVISDEEAGLSERPSLLESLQLQNASIMERLGCKHD